MDSKLPMVTTKTDAQPPTADSPKVEAKNHKTTDLCGNEYAGARCMKKHGHEGMHECLYWNNEQSVRWD